MTETTGYELYQDIVENRACLDFLINHVFLPPKLPQKAEEDETDKNFALVAFLRQAARDYASGPFIGQSCQEKQQQWARIYRMLRNTMYGVLTFQGVRDALLTMGGGDVLVFHIQTQNAGLILRNYVSDLEAHVQFETFECSPSNSQVIGATNRLLCSYPTGPCISVPYHIFYNTNFLDELSTFISEMSREELPRAQIYSTKAGHRVVEERDTNKPIYFTRLLMGIIQALGKPIPPETNPRKICKRIADDVLWNSALLPWRRSPLWLVFRVALQTTLVASSISEGILAHKEYKSFLLFVMAKLLKVAVLSNLNSDLLRVMQAKVGRRLYKLRGCNPELELVRYAHTVVQEAGDLLKSHWEEIQWQYDRSRGATCDVKGFQVAKETSISLLNGESYILTAKKQWHTDRIASKPSAVTIDLSSQETPRFGKQHTPKDLSTFLSTKNASQTSEYLLTVHDFEVWVEEHLSSWVKSVKQSQVAAACCELAECIEIYSNSIKSNLEKHIWNPENMSIIILTIMELWVEMDGMAIKAESLLKHYDPEIPLLIFAKLILPKRSQMARLCRVEDYISSRRKEGKYGSVFSDTIVATSFGVQYAQSKPRFSQLFAQITTDAMLRRQATQNDARTKNANYENLMQQSKAIPCTREIPENSSLPKRHKMKSCPSCSLKHRAGQQQVTVCEWPLPKDESAQWNVAFELECPVFFSRWRDTTYGVLVDVCTPLTSLPKTIQNPLAHLSSYEGLREYFTSRTGCRLAWASVTKPFAKSHYQNKKCPVIESQVLVPHALQYRLFDSNKKQWALDVIGKYDISAMCTYRLPLNSPYSNLQYALDNTSHTSNEVIAKQDECSHAIGLVEYEAFCTLRAGNIIQWMNIARELVCRGLSFNKEETYLLIMQAAWQVGPADPRPNYRGNVHRDNHFLLMDVRFCSQMIAAMEDMLSSIEANWCEGITARTLITLTTRLLSLITPETVVDKGYSGEIALNSAFGLLGKLRRTTYHWVKLIAEKHSRNPTTKTQMQTLDMALTTRMTFDIEGRHRASLNTSEELAIFIACGIIAHDNTPPDTSNLPTTTRILLERDRRLTQTFQPHLLTLGETLCQSLDYGIKEIWPTYSGSGGVWQVPPTITTQWVTNYIQPDSRNEKIELQVQFNILSGRLLVNGIHFGRLPKEYVSHPTYARIFNQDILGVTPSDMPGMMYQLKTPREGNQVHFGMKEKELVIRLEKDDRIWELIPYKKLLHDFPVSFVTSFAHFIELDMRIPHCVEFRPLENLWNRSSQNWYLREDFVRNVRGTLFPRRWVMERQSTSTEKVLLIDQRSATKQQIDQILCPLEDAEFIEVQLMQAEVFSIQLPRYKLRFKADQNVSELKCESFPGWVVDTDQSLGTLIGLQNRLILRQESQLPQQLRYPVPLGTLLQRRVLIPHGEVKYVTGATKKHTEVVIEVSREATSVTFHQYSIDTTLGQLSGSSTIYSRLYQIYLHAVTSYCLTDPLTGLTGTEAALENLRAAHMWSFQKLTQSEVDLMAKIASLTPARVYYPTHLKTMQCVSWAPLPPTAQHGEFDRLVSSILDYWRTISFLYPDERLELPKARGDDRLLKRARLQNLYRYPIEFSDISHTTIHTLDVPYKQRSHGKDDGDSAKVNEISYLVSKWSNRLNCSVDLWALFQEWGTVAGPKAGYVLRYDSILHTVELPDIWLSLAGLMSGATYDQRFSVMFMLTSLAFRGDVTLALVEALLAFATTSYDGGEWPGSGKYDLSFGVQPVKMRLEPHVRKCARTLNASRPFLTTAKLPTETEFSFQVRQRSEYERCVNTEVEDIVNHFTSQWYKYPALTIQPPGTTTFLKINDTTMAEIESLFGIWMKNFRLWLFIHNVTRWYSTQNHQQRELQNLTNQQYPDSQFVRLQRSGDVVSTMVDMSGLLNCRPPAGVRLALPELCSTTMSMSVSIGSPATGELTGPGKRADQLSDLIDEFQRPGSKFREIYGAGMRRSLVDFQKKCVQEGECHFDNQIPHTTIDLLGYQQSCEYYKNLSEKLLVMSMLPFSDSATNVSALIQGTLYDSGLWPRIRPNAILRMVGSRTNTQRPIPEEWKRAIISYGRAITALQQSRRLFVLARTQDKLGFAKELENQDDNGWSPMNYPDWLLFEIENNLKIRALQVDIAKNMISPPNGQNTVMQLNMGEGKSSVIVPIVASFLADRTKFVRVIVLKPLASQMFQMLAKKLGGLINRRIYYLPFSRAIKIEDVSTCQRIQSLFSECMEVGGVLIAQPEHLLSFKLIGVERIQERASLGVARQLLDSYKWLEGNARDVIDESDEILSVKYQLLYTMGNQTHFDGASNRWSVVQQILDLVRVWARDLGSSHYEGIEVEYLSPSCTHKDKPDFPLTRINTGLMERVMVALLIKDIRNDRLSTLPFRYLPPAIADLAEKYMTLEDTTQGEYSKLKTFFSNEIHMNTLHILRGLFCFRILFFALREKRYRVDYGLDLKRSMLAVPYKAKDSPSPRSEFGHPDVTIILTCLSYYYAGLTDAQLRLCFENLYKEGNLDQEYGRWVARDPSIPQTMRHLSGLNLQDHEQFYAQAFPRFRHNKAVIDFYLSTTVFPRAAKEFPNKLSTSGWDIAERRVHPTTGFSGTNDNQYLLPVSINQQDSAEQSHTNAKVLSNLINLERTFYECVQNPSGGRLHTIDLLRKLIKEDIHVLLDVGAQILEFTNDVVAQKWLELIRQQGDRLEGEEEYKWQAAVFFEDDEMWVLTHDGRKERLETSQFNMQMEKCVVYLDEAHTRGTDLNLPTYSIAAVTLGPKLTKDRLVQACMRMRKLGQGQSVGFYAPGEVHRQIMNTASGEQAISTIDVIRWTMDQTCAQTMQHVSLWAHQGSTYQWRQNTWLHHRDKIGTDAYLLTLKEGLLESESQTLSEQYGIPRKDLSVLPLTAPIPASYLNQILIDQVAIRHICTQFNISNLQGLRVQEEQEREVAFEIERETHRQNPVKRIPSAHALHEDMILLLRGWNLQTTSTAYMPAFDVFKSTSFNALLEAEAWAKDCTLYVSTDFANTVKAKKQKRPQMDTYLRSPGFMLSKREGFGDAIRELLIISPYEANEILNRLRDWHLTGKARLHIYAPKTGPSMTGMEALTYCAFPRLEPTYGFLRSDPGVRTIERLNLFAGQLYLKDYKSYLRLCSRLLGIAVGEFGEEIAHHIGTDGFVSSLGIRQKLGLSEQVAFSRSPIPLLNAVYNARRKGQSYHGTHMGSLLASQVLGERDFINELKKQGPED